MLQEFENSSLPDQIGDLGVVPKGDDFRMLAQLDGTGKGEEPARALRICADRSSVFQGLIDRRRSYIGFFQQVADAPQLDRVFQSRQERGQRIGIEIFEPVRSISA